jgi:hypothetical protein
MNQYRKVLPISRTEAIAVFGGIDVDRIRLTLVRIAFYDPDYEWAQARCLEFCVHNDPEVRGVAVTCLGHIARIHRRIDMGKVGPVLDKLACDSNVAGIVQDTLDDIRRFAA